MRAIFGITKFGSVIGASNKLATRGFMPLVTNKRNYTDFVSLLESSVAPVLTTALLTGGWLSTRYKIAGPNEYLVRTGIFIPDIDISKKAWYLPYQTLTKISLEPVTYHCVIKEAMSDERISFNMPTVFTVGPKDDLDFLKRYAKLLQQSSAEDLRSKIIGIILGETRMAAAKVSIDDLFNSRANFKEHIIKNIDDELSQFGLIVYNANIEELTDMEGNEYFVFLRKRALEGAVNDAKVAVAEKNKIGNIGEKKHVTETRQSVAEFEKIATLTENERDKEVAESRTKLDIAKADFSRQVKIAEYEANALSDKRKLELQKEVEEYRIKQETEKLRASEFTVANVKAEVSIRTAEGVASALKIQAAAEAEATRLRAEALFIQKQNEAKGILELRKAEAEGLHKLIESAGGVENLNSYLMIRDNVLEHIASTQAKSVQDMKPSITIWKTDSSNNDSGNLSNIVADLVKTGVPLVDGIKKTSGIDLLKGFRQEEQKVQSQVQKPKRIHYAKVGNSGNVNDEKIED